MNLIIETIKQHIKPNARLIVGFSGGPDSVFLLTMLVKLQQTMNLTIIAAHLNHQWRQESNDDAAWCHHFCNQLGNVQFESAKLQELPMTIKYNGSKEAYARQARRYFFQNLSDRYQADHIVLGHHANDNIETFFIRLARGTSLTGLCGMQKQDGQYVRPLLNISKAEIIAYLHENKIAYLSDSTNDDPIFLRNNIRKNLIPMLTSIDSRLCKNIHTIMNHFNELENFIEDYSINKLSELKDTRNAIDLSNFLKLESWLQQRLIAKLLIENNIACTLSKSLFAEIIRFLKKGTKKTHAITSLALICKEKNCFYFKSL